MSEKPNDGVGELYESNNGYQYDIRQVNKYWDFPIIDSAWGETFLLLRKLAGYRATAARAQEIGSAMLHEFHTRQRAYADYESAPTDKIAAEAYAVWVGTLRTLDALAADAAKLARGGG